jgi:hypothetical protein
MLKAALYGKFLAQLGALLTAKTTSISIVIVKSRWATWATSSAAGAAARAAERVKNAKYR